MTDILLETRPPEEGDAVWHETHIIGNEENPLSLGMSEAEVLATDVPLVGIVILSHPP